MASLDLAGLLALLDAHERFVLTTHVRPDCDALGSELGLAALLVARGKQVRIVNADPTPEAYAFLDPEDRIETLATAGEGCWRPGDLFIVLDTSAWKQLGPMAAVFRAATCHKAVIDHHRSSDDLGADVYKDIAAEATGRMIWEIAQAWGEPIPSVAAPALFAAITTDTGWFRFNSVQSRTYLAAADLVERGAQPHVLHEKLYEQGTLAGLRLHGRVAARAESVAEGRVIHAAAMLNDFVATGSRRDETDGLVNRLLEIQGAVASMLFVETEPESWKVSLRSRGDQFDCSQLAEQFDGGGHRNAAGIAFEGPIDTVRTPLLAAAYELIRASDALTHSTNQTASDGTADTADGGSGTAGSAESQAVGLK